MTRLLRSLAFLALLLADLPAQAADFYVSSVAYTAVTQWAALTTYAVGNCRRQLAAPAVNNERVFCVSAITTGISGAAEPTWTITSAGSTTDAGVTWIERTGVSTFQQQGGVTNTWTAPAARIRDLTSLGKNVVAAGDRIFLSSDHAETQATSWTLAVGTASSFVNFISVNRTTGNIPPLAADITSGASITVSSGSLELDGFGTWDGVSFISSSSSEIGFGFNTGASVYILNGGLTLGASGTQISIGNGNDSYITFDNTPITFGAAGQFITLGVSSSARFDWKNTPSAIAGTVPTTKLFGGAGTSRAVINVDGVDLSGLGANPLFVSAGATQMYIANFSRCKLGSSFPLPAGYGENVLQGVINFVDCDSANTNYNNARITYAGTLTTETTITRATGTTDGTQAVSHKIVTVAGARPPVIPFESFPIHIWNTAIGSSKTATIEIISSASLNNNDIWEECSYLGSTSSPIGTVASSYLATPLTAAAAVTTSTATWNSSPATPVKQKLQVTFTPQKVGLVSCIVKVGKASTTVYVDPLITLSRIFPANDNQEEIQNVA